MISRLCYPVTERRLKPIYDSLDNGNNKKALQEAEKVLRKQPDLQCAKVLKCLALLRMGRETDCTEQLDTIKNEKPTDESTLQLMTVCYRDINKPHMICELYENASKKEPGNEDILNNLFTSYVRNGDYKKQQLTAMALFKLNPKNQYYFWAIVSMLLQSVDDVSDIVEIFSEPINAPHLCAKDRPYAYNYLIDKEIISVNKNINIKLADKMLEKFYTEKKIELEQELLIYLIVLSMQDKNSQALKVLDSHERISLLNYKLFFQAKLKQWNTINVSMKEILEKGSDDWNYFLNYIDSAYELGKENSFDQEFLKAQEFIESLTKTQRRGTLLARIELCSRFSKFTNLLNYLVEYFNEFGSKESCVHDLKPYLHLLSSEDSSEFLKLIWELTKNIESCQKRMDYHICNEEFARVLDCKVYDKRVYVTQLIQSFIDSLDFNKDIPPTETRSSDRFALLALFTLYDSWIDTQMSKFLFEAVVICHYALLKSPSNSQFKVLLLKFYHILGCSDNAQGVFLSLDVKHMQLDTLGYLHLLPLIANASYTHALSVMLLAIKFYSTNKRECADHITLAYKFDAFTKIPEMIAIKEKLNNSLLCQIVNVEKMLLSAFLSETYQNLIQTIKDFDIVPEINQIPWESLQDNRDFKVLWDLEPRSRMLTDNEIIISYNLDVVYLSLRNLYLRIIVAGVQLGRTNLDEMSEIQNAENGETNNNKSFSSMKKILESLVNELDDDVTKLKNNPPKRTNKKPSVCAPPKSRLLLAFSQNYFDIVLNELWFLMSLIPGNSLNEKSSEQCKYRLGATMVLLEQFSDNFPKRSFNIEKRDELIQLCSLFIELISFSCLIIGISESILSKIKPSLVKKSKKKKKDGKPLTVPIEIEWRSDILNKFIIFLKDTVKKMESLLSSEEKMLYSEIDKYSEFDIYNILKQQSNENKFDKNYVIKHNEWAELESLSAIVNKDIINNHISSVNKMQCVLKSKLKYLTSVKI